jgi:hypothetical protein
MTSLPRSVFVAIGLIVFANIIGLIYMFASSYLPALNKFESKIGAAVAVILLICVPYVIYGVYSAARGNSSEKQQLLQSGTPATAQVLSIKQTGTFINNNPQVEMSLRIQPPDGPPYERTTRYVVPIIHASALQANSVIKVRIDPANAERIAIDEDWAK